MVTAVTRENRGPGETARGAFSFDLYITWVQLQRLIYDSQLKETPYVKQKNFNYV
jgi:hypothetical protein